MGPTDLSELVSLLATAPRELLVERRLRAYFTNMLRGLESGLVALSACETRLSPALQHLKLRRRATWSLFYSDLMAILDSMAELDHYMRPEPLDLDIDLPAVTFQTTVDAAMRAWVGRSATPRELVQAIARKTTVSGATVGRPTVPVWISPYTGGVKAVLDAARKSPSPTLALKARTLIAASNWALPEPVVAFITAKSIRDLEFEVVDSAGAPRITSPVGSTVIEARRHKHFRHWPRHDGPPDRYGRTYDLDLTVRVGEPAAFVRDQ